MIFNIAILFINIIVIIVISSIEFDSLSHFKLYRYDETIHFFMYFFLALFSAKALRFKFHLRNWFILLIILLLPFFTEYIQYYTPKRRADPSDLFYNYCGLLTGIITILIYRYATKNKN